MSATVLLGGQVDQIPGGHDDGTADRILRTKLDQGEMVLFRPRRQQWVNVSGNGTANITEAATYESSELGAPGRISMTTANFSAAASGQGDAGLGTTLWGRRFGLVMLTSPAFLASIELDAFIDGRCVMQRDVTNRFGRYDTTATNLGSAASGIQFWTLADDLPDDGPHQIEVWLRTPASGFSQVHILGFLVESRMGYRPSQPVESLLAPNGTANDLTTTYAQVPFSGYASSPQTTAYARGVRRLDYLNTDSIAHNVLVQTTLAGTAYVFKSVTVPAATTVNAIAVPGQASIDFGRPVGIDSTWTHKIAEAISTGGTKVTCIPFGAW